MSGPSRHYGRPGGPLIDELMPTWEARERHELPVNASAGRTFAALRNVNLAASPLVRSLFLLRALPAMAGAPRRAWRLAMRSTGTLRLHDFERAGFGVLGEDAPYEVVLGLEGAFWSARGGLQPVSAESFRQPPRAGTARAAWAFSIRPITEERCELSTETRVVCADDAARRRFRPYWLLVRPGSGMIRRMMLRAVRKAAERA